MTVSLVLKTLKGNQHAQRNLVTSLTVNLYTRIVLVVMTVLYGAYTWSCMVIINKYAKTRGHTSVFAARAKWC